MPISIMSGTPGSKIEWPKSASPFGLRGTSCEITNDTAFALLELTIPFQANYGSPPNQRFWDSNLITIRLDQGASNRRTFYIFNRFSDGGGLSFYDTATAFKLGDSIKKKVRIVRPENPVFQGALLFPFVSPPEEAVPLPKKRPNNNTPK